MHLVYGFVFLRGDNTYVYEITACFFCEINVLQFTLDLIAFGLLPHSNQHNFLRPGLTKWKSDAENWKTELSIGGEVVTNLYFKCAKFWVNKHQFKQLWRRQFSSVFKKKSNQNSCKTCLSFGVNRSSHTSLIIRKGHDKNHHLCPVRPVPFIYYSFHFCHNMLFAFLHIY